MEVIQKEISYDFKALIIKAYQQIETKLNAPNNRTHHLNIYHSNWDENNKTSLKILEILQRNYGIPTEKVISLGFISSQPDCKDQHFHIDYKGVTNTYFIPLTEITEKNGTEYLEFVSSVKNISLFSHLKKIGDRFISREGVSGYLNSINISPDEYSFHIFSGPPFSLLYLPNYVLHRGTKNGEKYIKVMFQIIVQAIKGATVSSKVEHLDSELDEDDDIIEVLMSSRKDRIDTN